MEPDQGNLAWPIKWMQGELGLHLYSKEQEPDSKRISSCPLKVAKANEKQNGKEESYRANVMPLVSREIMFLRHWDTPNLSSLRWNYVNNVCVKKLVFLMLETLEESCS